MLSYLDPASGSAIISAVAAGAAGAGVAAKSMLARFRAKKAAEGPSAPIESEETSDPIA